MNPLTPLNPLPAAPALDRSQSDVVLIVDDVPDNLAVLHDALDESGYTVLVATHGEAALQRAAQALPDIVLLDAMMPGIDGFETCRELRELPGFELMPVLSEVFPFSLLGVAVAFGVGRRGGGEG